MYVHIEVCIKVGSKKISYTMMHGRKNIKPLCICCALCAFVAPTCIVVPCVYLLYYVCIAVLKSDAGLLARS